MKSKYYFGGSLLLSALSAAIYFFVDLGHLTPIFAILAILAFTLSSIGLESLKRFTYSGFILTAVAAAMFYPQFFTKVGDFELKLLIVPLLQIIMFGMGSQMSVEDFRGVVKMPRGVIIGLICQFTIMPLVGFSLISMFDFPAEVAAGIVLVGCSPSGLASNVMSFIARANLALSITITAFATLLSPLTTPLITKLLVGHSVPMDFLKMTVSIFNMVIMPICAGLIFNNFSKKAKEVPTRNLQTMGMLLVMLLKNVMLFFSEGLSLQVVLHNTLLDIVIFATAPLLLAQLMLHYQERKGTVDLEQILSLVSMTGIGVIITIITAAGRDSLLQVGLVLVLACLLHNCLGYGLGYGLSRLLRLKEQDCRTIALEVGMQNGGLASGIAVEMGKLATLGLAPAIFGAMMNITGSSLASYWRRVDPEKAGKVPSEEKQAMEVV